MGTRTPPARLADRVRGGRRLHVRRQVRETSYDTHTALGHVLTVSDPARRRWPRTPPASAPSPPNHRRRRRQVVPLKGVGGTGNPAGGFPGRPAGGRAGPRPPRWRHATTWPRAARRPRRARTEPRPDPPRAGALSSSAARLAALHYGDGSAAVATPTARTRVLLDKAAGRTSGAPGQSITGTGGSATDVSPHAREWGGDRHERPGARRGGLCAERDPPRSAPEPGPRRSGSGRRRRRRPRDTPASRRAGRGGVHRDQHVSRPFQGTRDRPNQTERIGPCW